MQVEIELQEDLPAPYVKIFTQEIDAQTQKIYQRIKALDEKNDFLLLWQEDKYQVVKQKDIQLVRYENSEITYYVGNQRYTGNQRLYQVEEELEESFLRISKTTLINMHHVDSVEPSFNSTMVVKMQNEEKDYISRKYLPAFKKFLGL